MLRRKRPPAFRSRAKRPEARSNAPSHRARPSRPDAPPLPLGPDAATAADAVAGALAGTLEGVLERIVYTNEENGWSVVRLIAGGDTGRGRERLVTAVGTMPGVQPGERLRLRGRWTTDPKYGHQFRADSCLAVRPRTIEGIEKYLGSGLVPGIGPEMAKRLVRRFGIETLDVIEGDPRRLTEVPGIGRVRSEAIRSAWQEHRAVKDVMVFLHSHAITPNQAMRIYREYGDRSIPAVRENPYRLATDIIGIGFRTADRIAESLSIPRDSPRRIEAGVLHVLSEGADQGHVFLPRDTLAARAAELLDVDESPIGTALETLSGDGRIVLEDNGRPAVYLAGMHAAEAESARRLAELISTAPRPVPLDVDRAVAWFESKQGIELGDGQRDALRRALTSRILVITGGPGTGKTTLVNGITRILERKGVRILMCAPTGRAARRLAETTGREARTIHRLLEFNPKEMKFARNENAPLETDLLVLDEASMVDTLLLSHLLRAVPPPCRLVLVGDVDQLPSVGPGNVLRDLIRSGAVAVALLDRIYRQAGSSSIIVNAHRINHGEMPLTGRDPGVESGESDFFFVPREQPEDVLSTIRNLVAERIPGKFGLDPVEDIQVLAPMHRGLLGAANLNAELQALLNPPEGEDRRAAAEPGAIRSFRTGDKVMQIRNNYNLDVFNGDIGRVVRVDPATRTVLVRFDERTVGYQPADLDELVLAYACSVHKSQGSEYPAVVMPLHTQHYMMLQRNLLYTAVTRGRRLVILVGSRRALGVAVRNNRIEERYTRLADRIASATAGRTV